jgi:hypothetical protein
MPLLEWPSRIDRAFRRYADALDRVPGFTAEVAEFRETVLRAPESEWQMAAMVARWERFRPHAILRRIREQSEKGLRGFAARLIPTSPSWEELLHEQDAHWLAAEVDGEIGRLAPWHWPFRLGRFAEGIAEWPKEPADLMTAWPELRQAFLRLVSPEAQLKLSTRMNEEMDSPLPILFPPAQGTWPESTLLFSDGIIARPDTAPVGTILEVQRTSLLPNHARATISIGSPDSGLALAYELWNTSAESMWREALTSVVERLRREEDIEPTAWLPVLAEAAKLEPSVQEPLRKLLEKQGLELLSGQRFAVVPEQEGAEYLLIPRFRENPFGELVRARRYGLRNHDEVISPAELIVSIGPPPPGFPELEKASTELPSPFPEQLAQHFSGLRLAMLLGYAEAVWVELFQTFWGIPGATQQVAFAESLEKYLQDQWQWSTFRPSQFFDHEQGWVMVPPGVRVTTGRVTAVARPGLIDSTGSLRLPAVVFAE